MPKPPRSNTVPQAGVLLSVALAQARKVPSLDAFGNSDPFCVLSAGYRGGHILKLRETPVRFNTDKPVWNSRFDIVFDQNKLPDIVIVELWDRDLGSADDFIASVHFDFADIVDSKTSGWNWVQCRNKRGYPAGEVQLQLKASVLDNSSELTQLDFAHCLELTVLEAKELRRPDGQTQNEPFVLATFGGKHFRTKAASNSERPEWAQTAYFFVDQHAKKYDLLLHVLNSDTYDTSVGRVYVDTSELFEHGSADMWLPVSNFHVTTDKDIVQYLRDRAKQKAEHVAHQAQEEDDAVHSNKVSDLPAAEQLKSETQDTHLGVEEESVTSHSSTSVPAVGEICGYLHIRAALHSRETLEKEFVQWMIANFSTSETLDALTVDEFAEALTVTAGEALDLSAVEEFVGSADLDGDGRVQEQELMQFVASLQFQASPFMPLLLQAWLQTGRTDATQLMNGVTAAHSYFGVKLYESRSMSDAELVEHPPATLTVKERTTGLLVKEHIPAYVNVALKAMFGSAVARKLTRGSERLMTTLSRRQGRLYDAARSKNEIPKFIALHNIDVNELEKPLEEYHTFNDFFARGLKEGARPVEGDEMTLVSAADCRLSVFENLQKSTEWWIKGKQFTVEGLLDRRADLADTFREGSCAIFRLAPQDYHRFHVPCDATLKSIHKVEGPLYTVNPIAINRNVDVFTRNKRWVVEFETDYFGKMVFVCVGATMVGSIVLTSETPGTRFERGEVFGEFRFGGSTCICLFEKDVVQFDQDLLENSRYDPASNKTPVETLLRCNTRIGLATQVPARDSE
ncbi:MAG: hypothetical protein MHM6MM_000604 [Cercozoa sp. M6MM]